MTAPSIDQWGPDLMTFHGQVLEYDGVCYRAKYAHLTMQSAPPPTDPTLWDHINP